METNKNNICFVTKSSAYKNNTGDIIVASSTHLTNNIKLIDVKYYSLSYHTNKGNEIIRITILKIFGTHNTTKTFTKIKSEKKELNYLRNILYGC